MLWLGVEKLKKSFLILLMMMLVITQASLAFEMEDWGRQRSKVAEAATKLRCDFSNLSSRVVAPAENLSVPVDVWSNGTVKILISARLAQLFKDVGLIWGKDVIVREFTQDGEEKTKVTAEQCLVNRNSKCGWVEGLASANQAGVVLVGTNAYFSSTDEYLKFFGGVDVTVNDLKAVKSELSTKDEAMGKMRIRAEFADYDRKNGIIYFEREVKVDSDDRKLTSNRLYAFLVGTNDLKRIVADGEVRIREAKRQAQAQMARFLRAEDKVELIGSAGEAAVLREDNGNEVRGGVVRYFRDTEQFEVENSEIIIHNRGDKTVESQLHL